MSSLILNAKTEFKHTVSFDSELQELNTLRETVHSHGLFGSAVFCSLYLFPLTSYGVVYSRSSLFVDDFEYKDYVSALTSVFYNW